MESCQVEGNDKEREKNEKISGSDEKQKIIVFFKQICCYCNLFYPASEMNGMKADSLSSPTGSQNFSFSRTSSTGSIPAVGCTSSASSAQNSGKFPVLHLRTMFVFLC